MTKEEILKQTEELLVGYTVKNGFIQNPGKFEGEPPCTLYFYNLMLNDGGTDIYEEGEDDYSGFIGTEFQLEQEEKEAFNLEKYNYVMITVTNDGFVCADFYYTSKAD